MIYMNVTTKHPTKESISEYYFNWTTIDDIDKKKIINDTITTIFQITSGQLPETLALLYLNELGGFDWNRPTLKENINIIAKEILTHGRDSVNITFTTKSRPINQSGERSR